MFITHYFRHHGNGGGGMAGSVGDARQVHGESSANPLHLNTTSLTECSLQHEVQL